eukprot:1171772-Pleurochrysis_carterae.AAC.1
MLSRRCAAPASGRTDATAAATGTGCDSGTAAAAAFAVAVDAASAGPCERTAMPTSRSPK